MPNLIEPIWDLSIAEGLRLLSEAHSFILSHAAQQAASNPAAPSDWGIRQKRSVVTFPEDRPDLIGKDREKFQEVVNMMATVERLISALEYFSGDPELRALVILECHPTTSSGANQPDLRLGPHLGQPETVRCEVTDIDSDNASHNNKEAEVLRAVGFGNHDPAGVRLLVCTSVRWARALASRVGPRAELPHAYLELWRSGDLSEQTAILEVVPLHQP